jgi:chorismate synthase
MTHAITIQSVPEPDAALGDQLVQLQKAVWGSEPDDVLPSWRFVVTPRTGGELLVAHAGGELVGFALCSPGIEKEYETYLYLDLLGVHPSHRHARVGEQLMRALAEAAPERFVYKLRWTFDPLEGANANLYLAKLGARGIRFLPNLYGSMARAGQQGERSDRLLAELDVVAELRGPRMRQPRPLLVVDPTTVLPASLPARIALAVPASYAKLRASDTESARAVRLGSGRILEQLFAAGFAITDFERGEHTSHLIAERAPPASADDSNHEKDAELQGEDIDDEAARVLARLVAEHLLDRHHRVHQWAWELFSWDLRIKRPEAAWRIFLATWPLVKSNDDALVLLAGFPLEDLIANHGARLIERIEDFARRDIDFARLLGGVRQSSTPDDIWRRIEKVRHHVW